MRLVGYLRVSTIDQSENTSLGQQREKVESYCKAFGHELVAVFSEVGSGKNISDRPQLQQAIEKLSEADGIIAAKLDRLGRSTRDILNLVEDILRPNKKALILLDLNIDTSTPNGEMILTVMAAVATAERRIITERCQGGRKIKAENGGYAFGAPQFGKKSVDGVLVDNPVEQEIINLIRRHRRSGKSLNAIALYLNTNNIPGKRGGAWTAQGVKNILVRTRKQKVSL